MHTFRSVTMAGCRKEGLLGFVSVERGGGKKEEGVDVFVEDGRKRFGDLGGG